MSWIGDNAVGLLNFGSSLLNFGLQKKNFDYQKALQKEIFAREDTAVQRRMSDLQAAGLNPNLAAGSGAGAGSVVSTSAPQLDKANIGTKLDAQIHEEQLKQAKYITQQEKNAMHLSQAQAGLAGIEKEMQKMYLDMWKGDFSGMEKYPIYRKFIYDMNNSFNQSEMLRKQNAWYTTNQVESLIDTGADVADTVMEGFNTYAKVGKILKGNLNFKNRR